MVIKTILYVYAKSKDGTIKVDTIVPVSADLNTRMFLGETVFLFDKTMKVHEVRHVMDGRISIVELGEESILANTVVEYHLRYDTNE